MGITFHPSAGQILCCDFSEGFRPPEMVKRRPVVILSPRPQRGAHDGTCLVVALSTVPPQHEQPYHRLLQIPAPFPKPLLAECWLKGNMIYAVSLNRLHFYHFEKNDKGERMGYSLRLSAAELAAVRHCVAAAIGHHP